MQVLVRMPARGISRRNSEGSIPYAEQHILVLCREKRQAAKSMGKHHASSSEDDSDGDAHGDEGAGADDDPFFTHEEDPFSDPFFQVPCSCPGYDITRSALNI